MARGLTGEMLRVLRIADRDGIVVAGTGAHAGRVERVNASTVLSLVRRGLLSHAYGSEGGLGGRLTEAGRAALAEHVADRPAHATKKSTRQLDAEIAEALAKPTPSGQERRLHVRLPTGLARAVMKRSGTAVFHAMKRANTGYTFESSDPGVVRAFWSALTEVYYRPPTGAGGRAIGEAAATKRAELRPIIEQSWPEALAE